MNSDGLSPVPDDFELGATIRGFVVGQRLFERYELRQVLGRGGMGVVWLALDEKLEQEIALKFLPEVVRLDASALDELKRETRRSRSLTHPHVVRIHDFVDDATAAAISMEFVNGATLSTLRVQQPTRVLEPEQIAEWLRQLCEALQYAHRKVKIVHRDLKPANLMINMEGDMKVTDFGIARSISDSVSRVTMSRGSSGTLAYMSPQQTAGEPPSVGDDIYSLGATIYELLTSKPPFYSGDIPGQIRDKVPPNIAQRREVLEIGGASIPEEWEETIAACLAKDPADRPQSAAELAQRLGLQSTYVPEPVVVKTRSTPKVEAPVTVAPSLTESASTTSEPPNKSHAMLVTIVILLLIGGACFGWYFGIDQPAEQEKLRQVQIAQQEAIQKEKDLEAQATADATEKARLQAEAQKAADEAAQLKTEAEKAKQAADDAAIAKALADRQAADQAAESRALADRQAAAAAAAAARVTPITGTTPLDELQRRAQAGESAAQAQLGYDYATGTLVTKDYQQSLYWLQKAADQGNALGQENLGFMYQNGHGVAVDQAQAFSLYEKAAAQEDPSAQYQLGIMYENGQGVAKDYSQALLWYQKAAAHGSDFAQSEIGYLYETGRGVPMNYLTALSWYQKAADQGNDVAQNNIGNMYYNGRGVAKDRNTAIEWYRKSAAKGNVNARQNLKNIGLSP